MARNGSFRRVSLKSERDRRKTKQYLEMKEHHEFIKRQRRLGLDPIKNGNDYREQDQSPLGGGYYENFGDDGDGNNSDGNDDDDNWTEDEDEQHSTTEGDDGTPPSLEYSCATGGKKLKKLLAADSNEPSKHVAESEALYQNWQKFIRLSMSESSICLPTKCFPDVSSTPLYRCNCQPSRHRFTAVFLDRIFYSINLC
jgi:hypothetical protein